jgi:hypothetical protein
MKRFIAVVAAFSVAGAVYVATAAGSRHVHTTSARQFAALKRQVLGLSKKVRAQDRTIKTLDSELTALKGQVGTEATTLTTVQGQLSTVQTTSAKDDAFIGNCLVAGGVAGVSQYGDPAGSFGYLFQDSSGGYLTSALDIDSSAAPDAYFQLMAPGCLSSGAEHQNGGVAVPRRKALGESAASVGGPAAGAPA